MAGMSQRDVQRMGAVTHLCTLISEHAPDLIPSSRHSEITKAPEVMPKSSARHIALPIEVWEHIILRLDTLNLSSITQVSKELCHLTKSTSFRARYLLKHYSKSEAIYKATCHLSVVDEDLLKLMLDMGAIMSRHFVQCLNVEYIQQQSSKLNNSGWKRRISERTHAAVLAQAKILYGNSLGDNINTDDYDAVLRWMRSTEKRRVMNNKIMEIFTIGKYAPFRDFDAMHGREMIPAIVARHPQLVEVLKRNGYTISDTDLTRSVSRILSSDWDEEEEDLYKRINDLIQRCSPCKASGSACSNLVSMLTLVCAPAIASEEGMRLAMKQGDGVIRVPNALKVVKRLYPEGKAFEDLGPQLVHSLRRREGFGHFTWQSSPGSRVLYRYFPELLQEIKENLAEAIIDAWQDARHHSSRDETRDKIRQDSLLDFLNELSLEPLQLARAISHGDPIDVLPICLDNGLFGSNLDQFDLIIQTMIEQHIDNPLAGKQIRELNRAINNCKEISMGTQKRLLGSSYFANQMQIVLSKWTFDLDLLKPDRPDMVGTRFKSPLGWMVEGFIMIKVDIALYDKHTYVKPQDPYLLMFKSLDDYHGYRCVAFHLANRVIWRRDDQYNKCKGLRIGEIEETEQLSTVLPLNNNSPSRDSHDDASRYMLESYARTVRMVNLLTCGEKRQCDSCDRSRQNKSIKKQETSQALMELLDVDSTGIQDVLLSHALVNGNVELITKLMSGRHCSKEGEKARQGENKAINKPALPTLAHFMILQKLARSPLPIFTNHILKGAPFQRGYVKSTIFFNRQKEIDLDQRQKRYKEKGQRDDHPLTGLYREMQRLKELDKASSQTGDGALVAFAESAEASNIRMDSIEDSENKDESADQVHLIESSKVNLVASKRKKATKIRFKCNNIRYDITLNELIYHKKSLLLWREHLEVLQWFEERLQKITVAKMSKTTIVEKNLRKSQFALGLEELIKKIAELEKVMLNQLEDHSM